MKAGRKRDREEGKRKARSKQEERKLILSNV